MIVKLFIITDDGLGKKSTLRKKLPNIVFYHLMKLILFGENIQTVFKNVISLNLS